MPQGSSSPPRTLASRAMVVSDRYFAGRSLPCTCAETTPLPAVLPLGFASFFGLRTSRPPFSLLPIPDSSVSLRSVASLSTVRAAGGPGEGPWQLGWTAEEADRDGTCCCHGWERQARSRLHRRPGRARVGRRERRSRR